MAHFWSRTNSLIRAIGVPPLRFAVLNWIIRAICGTQFAYPRNRRSATAFRCTQFQIRLSAQFAVLNWIIHAICGTQFAYLT
jgi:hypothetical protein